MSRIPAARGPTTRCDPLGCVRGLGQTTYFIWSLSLQDLLDSSIFSVKMCPHVSQWLTNALPTSKHNFYSSRALLCSNSTLYTKCAQCIFYTDQKNIVQFYTYRK